MKNVLRFAQEESGATAIEYGLIASLIAVAMIFGATQVGTTLNSKFSEISTKVSTAGANAGAPAGGSGGGTGGGTGGTGGSGGSTN